ncbi:MAG TPA: hypothetical protein VMH79_03460 [Thermoanaerobaculia bacterium]|nr:hypothetical protein [Thermoanaerobaculia bacterium]
MRSQPAALLVVTGEPCCGGTSMTAVDPDAGAGIDVEGGPGMPLRGVVVGQGIEPAPTT